MPKKTKKVKKKGKAKGKGKGKKKGKKKGAKRGDGVDKEATLKEAIATAKLWEARYGASEQSRQQYRQSALQLIAENETLQSAIQKTERDTIEVITFLKKEDSQKDNQVLQLRSKVHDLQQGLIRDWEDKETRYEDSIAQLQQDISSKEHEIAVLHSELKTMREFRRKRAELQEQLEAMRQALGDAHYAHEQQVTSLEQKYFEEKVRLQKEANHQIEKLALQAHNEALANLERRTRSVYRENAVMADALSLHVSEEQSLRQQKERLEMANRKLAAEKELSQQLAQEKVQQAQKHKKLIRELQGKVTALEQSLTVMVREFEKERQEETVRHQQQLESCSNELSTLRHHYQLQKREMAHVRRLSRGLLDQRTELESFFISALAHVKKEIAANRAQYQQEAQRAYHHQMAEAGQGGKSFPAVTTFRPSLTSTQSVYHEMTMAELWDLESDQVDVSELTWEQREQVLRLLFAKMNSKECKPCPLPSINNGRKILPAIGSSSATVPAGLSHMHQLPTALPI